MNMSKSKTCACLNLRGLVIGRLQTFLLSRPNRLDKYSVPDSSVGNPLGLSSPAHVLFVERLTKNILQAADTHNSYLHLLFTPFPD